MSHFPSILPSIIEFTPLRIIVHIIKTETETYKNIPATLEYRNVKNSEAKHDVKKNLLCTDHLLYLLNSKILPPSKTKTKL